MKHSSLKVTITRGGCMESQHLVKAIIVNNQGEILESWGDIDTPVYPRSAIKAMQALPMIEAEGHKRFGFSSEEIAICCASHNGENTHHKTVENMLSKLGYTENNFECGIHWPLRAETSYQLAATGVKPDQLHNNCSGKHAGMLALAKVLDCEPRGYIEVDHPVQKAIAKVMSEMCEYDYTQANWSPDGCSAPTWAIPMRNLALAFAKFASPEHLNEARRLACLTLYDAVVKHPFMVAGTERYCTDMMTVLGDKVFLKTGAEGVYVAAIPSLKLAIAIKCEDGATRAAESAMTTLLDHVGITKGISDESLSRFRRPIISNWNKRITGDIVCQLD